MSSTATVDQLERLVDFMESNQDLARGRLLRDVSGKARAKRLWLELTNRLNSMGGCLKTTKQWQKVWADKKYTAKKAAAAARRSANETGGGPSSAPFLNEMELKIIGLMGEGYGLPASAACTHAFPQQASIENVPLIVVPTCTSQPSPSTDVIPTTMMIDTPAIHPSDLPPMELPSGSSIGASTGREAIEGVNPSAHSINTQQSVNQHPREIRFTPRRRRRVQEDIRKKLIKLEEEKIKEIVALREAIERLNETIATGFSGLQNSTRN